MKLSSIASQTPICDGLFVARPYVDARRPAEYNHRRWYVYLRDVAATGHRIIGPYGEGRSSSTMPTMVEHPFVALSRISSYW